MGGGSSPKPPDTRGAAIEQGKADKATAMYTTALDRPNQYDPYGSVTWQFGGSVPGRTGPTAAQSAQLKSLQDQLKRTNSLRTAGRERDITPQEKSKRIASINAQIAAINNSITSVSGSRENPQPGDWRQVTTLTPQEQAIFNAQQANRLGLEQLASKGVGVAGKVLGSEFTPFSSNRQFGIAANYAALLEAQKKGDTAAANKYRAELNRLKSLPAEVTEVGALGQSQYAMPSVRQATVGLPSWAGSSVALPDWALGGEAPQWQALQDQMPEYAGPEGDIAQWQALQGNVPQWQQSQMALPEDQYANFTNQLTGMEDLSTDPNMFSQDREAVTNALYQQMTRFNEERFGREEAAMQTRLANMGLQPGSAAYEREMQEFRRSKDEAYGGAQLQALLAGGQEQSRQYQNLLAGTQTNIGRRQAESGIDLSRMGAQSASQLARYGMGLQERQAGFGAEMAARQQQMGEAQYGYEANINRRLQQQQELQALFENQMMGRGQQFAEAQYGFGADMQRRQQQMAEEQARFGAGMERYGMGLQERQAGFDAGSQRYGLEQQNLSRLFGQEANRYQMGLGEREAQQQGQMNQYNAYMNQRQQLFQEQAYKRGLPISEISALMGASPVQMPQFSAFAPSTPFNAPNLYGAEMDAYGARVDASNAANANRAQTYGTVGTLALAAAMY